MPRHIKSLKNISWFQTHKMLLFAVLFAAIGTYLVFITQAATNTQTFTGKITTRQQTQSFDIAVVAGQLDAMLTLKDTASMTLTLSDASGTVVANKTGPTPLSLSTPVTDGSYKLTVASAGQIPKKGITFSLSATYSTANDSVAPTTPSNLSAKPISTTVVDLTWAASTDNVGVTGYDIYRGGVKVGTTAATTYADTGLTASTTYSYEVKARDAAGNTSSPATASATTLAPTGDTQAPTAPTGLSAAAQGNNQINLNWTASSDNVGVASYDIYANGNIRASNITATSFSDTGLTAGTTYSYYVKAKDAAGNVSPQSNTASATTTSTSNDTQPPTAPTNLSADAVSSTKVNITWTASTDNVGVAGYRIYRDKTFIAPNQIGSVTPDNTSFTDTAAKPNTVHVYTIEAYDVAGNRNEQTRRVVMPIGINITINSPASGSTQSGTISVNGTATTENGSVAKVEIGGSYGSYQLAQGTTNWSANLDTIKIPDSSFNKEYNYTLVNRYLFVKVTDSTGNFRVMPQTVIIKNDNTPPELTITSPANGSTQSGFYTVTGTASDAAGIQKIELTSSLSGGLIEATGTTNWTAKVMVGSKYPIDTVTAFDMNGNRTVVKYNVVNSTQLPTGTISGKVYQDDNKNGNYDSGEPVHANQYVSLYSTQGKIGQYLGKGGLTDASGNYTITNLPDGEYKLTYNGLETELKTDTVPTVNSPVHMSYDKPYQTVQLRGVATANFGWRKVTRIPDPYTSSRPNYLPMTTFVGANGLTAMQHDDYVTAQEIYNRTVAGKLIGEETKTSKVSQGRTISDSYLGGLAQLSWGSDVNCSYAEGTAYVYWPKWFGRYANYDDDILFHEYGHVWENYWGCFHQDTNAMEYSQHRGLDLIDPRTNTSHAWSTQEIQAEDYRQLFGNDAVKDLQENPNIPRPAEIPGFKEYLINTFRTRR